MSLINLEAIVQFLLNMCLCDASSWQSHLTTHQSNIGIWLKRSDWIAPTYFRVWLEGSYSELTSFHLNLNLSRAWSTQYSILRASACKLVMSKSELSRGGGMILNKGGSKTRQRMFERSLTWGLQNESLNPPHSSTASWRYLKIQSRSSCSHFTWDPSSCHLIGISMVLSSTSRVEISSVKWFGVNKRA